MAIKKLAAKFWSKLDAIVKDVLMHLAIKRANARTSHSVEVVMNMSAQRIDVKESSESLESVYTPKESIALSSLINEKPIYIGDNHPILLAFKHDRVLLASLLSNITISVSITF